MYVLGKSTLLRLVTRLLDGYEGEILLNGVNMKMIPTAALRRRIAIVPQDTVLFDNTVAYNIKYGSEGSSDAKVQEAVEKCGLKLTLMRLRYGLQTPVGQRGSRLSGGERQKIALARYAMLMIMMMNVIMNVMRMLMSMLLLVLILIMMN